MNMNKIYRHPIYKKTTNVFDSCETNSHFKVARKYRELAEKKIRNSHSKEFADIFDLFISIYVTEYFVNRKGILDESYDGV